MAFSRLISVSIGAAALLAALGASPAVAEMVTARGVVFHDRDRDGARDNGERGIGGVGVSNGEEVVVTDADGRYEIEIDANDGRVFVIKPRGHQVPLDVQNKPRFYYLHKPEGSPDSGFHFAGVAPTGDLPESIDFPLTPQAEPERFSIIAFGDPQPYNIEQIDFFRSEVVDPVLGEHDIAFGISLGDLVGDQLELFEPLNQAQALFGVPWHNVYGNHDMNALSGASAATADDPDRYADETFERVYGPTDYAFQYGRVHFIVLDDVIWKGFDGYRENTPDNWPRDRKPDVGNYKGGLHPHQLSFVDNYLDLVPKDDLVVLAFHIPIEGPEVHRIPEQRRLFEILSSHPNTFSLSGHTHLQRHWFFGPRAGYAASGSNQHTRRDPKRFPAPVHHHLNAVTASGSWYNGMLDETGMPHTTMRCGAPNGYTLVHFDGAEYRTEFRAARQPASHQMNISMPAELVIGSEEPAEIVVNIFNGAPGDRVEMRITPRPGAAGASAGWTRLTFDPREDPMYQAIHEREERLPEELVWNWGLPDPRESHHIWSGALDASSLAPGTHLVEVRHIDLYGVERVGRRTVRVVE